MLENYYAVIMAGGGGTRLWPLSRQTRPKQMLKLFDARTLFQTAVDRLGSIFPGERILVVTVEEQAKELHSQCPFLPFENFLIEPMPRGTASVVGLAAAVLKQRDPESVMAVLTADHYIGNEENFRSLLMTGEEVAHQDYLVTLGITPTYPSTGYGYIQQGEPLGTYGERDVYHVLRFKEKPGEEQAKQMLVGGDHAWNSGMFIWRTDRILEEFQRQMPDLYHSLEKISTSWNTPDRIQTVHQIWPAIKSETIDYGIMEGAERVAVIPAADLGWSDVGSWDSLFEVLPSDEYGNIVLGGQHIGLDSSGSLIYVNNGSRIMVTIGVSDLVLVDTGDVVLVCPKDQAQKVREVVNILKETGQDYI
jgi:mannose-1-phosphate guanylyltransferase